ncbi:hypothetical protein COOONC_05095 [Cooperia oncophora]
MWVFFLLLPVLGIVSAVSQEVIYVGQVYQKPLSQKDRVFSGDGGKLPSWLLLRDGILEGIPGERDVGKHTIKIFSRSKEEKVLELVVKEDHRNPCGSDDTYWVEALFENDGPVACGDNLDSATDEMDVILTAVENIEHEIYVVLTHGRVVPPPNDVTVESSTSGKVTTTTRESTTSRTTRRVDNPPVKLNSLSGFTCTR